MPMSYIPPSQAWFIRENKAIGGPSLSSDRKGIVEIFSVIMNKEEWTKRRGHSQGEREPEALED